jgi:hypothetical protein
MTQPGQGIRRVISRGEATERKLGALIERRSRKGEIDPDKREEPWKESVRTYSAHRREEMKPSGVSTTKDRRGGSGLSWKG